jgi:hypothetical protein
MVRSYRAGRPVGFDRQQESPEMLPMSEPIEQMLRDDNQVGEMELVQAVLTAAPEFRRYLQGM